METLIGARISPIQLNGALYMIAYVEDVEPSQPLSDCAVTIIDSGR